MTPGSKKASLSLFHILYLYITMVTHYITPLMCYIYSYERTYDVRCSSFRLSCSLFGARARPFSLLRVSFLRLSRSLQPAVVGGLANVQCRRRRPWISRNVDIIAGRQAGRLSACGGGWILHVTRYSAVYPTPVCFDPFRGRHPCRFAQKHVPGSTSIYTQGWQERAYTLKTPAGIAAELVSSSPIAKEP